MTPEQLKIKLQALKKSYAEEKLVMTLWCKGVINHNSGWVEQFHDFCQGFGYDLVEGEVEYRKDVCKCGCHKT